LIPADPGESLVGTEESRNVGQDLKEREGSGVCFACCPGSRDHLRKCRPLCRGL
ncbi:mCG1038975, isoform CRA_b, partial [Mus musculus]